MPFTKNDPNINRNGRKQGSKNKRTTELRNLIKLVHEMNLQAIHDMLESLSIRERLILNRDLISYSISRFYDPDTSAIEKAVNLPQWMNDKHEWDNE
jgi:hypothetical protein